MAQSAERLVGRDADLETLAGLVGLGSGLLATGGRHVLLAGDAGVGKTRILHELRGRAAADGRQTLVGHCLDFGDSAEAYLPFTEILDSITTALPDVVAGVADVHPALLRMAPVARALGGTDPELQEALDRGNLFAAIHALLERAAEKAPVLVVVEDTHWADQSTRDLLTFLFTRPFDGPVTLVASYRADDLHRRHPLRRQLAEWTRLPSVERFHLGRLSDDDVRLLVAELAADPDAGDGAGLDAESIVRRADGNAFFVEELVQAAGADELPWDLADLLLIRLDQLDATAREVVDTASAAGRDVSDELLEAVAGLDRATLDAGLRQAIERAILVPRDDGYYVFRHALLGEAVYDDLLPGERVRLHQRYVEALSSGLATGNAAGLARHARLAGDHETALRAGIAAGDEAAAAGGPDEASQHYQQAIALLAGRAASEEDTQRLVELVVKASDAMVAAGHADRAGKLAREQRESLPADAPGLWRAQLLTVEIETSFAYVNDVRVGELAEAAMAALPDDAPPKVRARLLAAYARELMIARRYDDAEAAGQEALALAEELGRSGLAAEVAVTLAASWGRPPQPWIEPLRTAVERAARVGALHPELRGRLQLGFALDAADRLDEAGETYRSAFELGVERGVPWAPYAFDARIAWFDYLHTTGRWDEALALTDAHGIPPALWPWLESKRLKIEQARGADVAAEARRLRPTWKQEVATARDSVLVEMKAAGARGDVAAVVEAYDAGVGALGTGWGEWFGANARLSAIAVGAVCAALPAMPVGERPQVMTHVERLLEEGTRPPGWDQPWGLEGQAWSARVLAEGLRARWLAGISVPDQTELVEAWRVTVAAFEVFPDVHELAWSRVRLAEILRAGGDAAAARPLAEKAREAAKRLGARPILDHLHALGTAPQRSSAGPSDQLTARESEILALVAAGRSNGEIGKQLFISTKTVSVHVSNILAKLGASGRTEAAAIGRRRGLVE
ncbi:DNA-binding CsgD family transcriptional regulator [Nocardioides luteus]|uniref:LuxR family transcriptional regulator n=1 Tax=Nocardioides luteus TaxID=1844 RepID=A0ABQ5SYH8_9ACTN|nr:helix-turn-helix transcriptional regulator [Nocardioides luteus]MDR7312471.1 DNA-binding CsgD family transcriptional regulator [Nocardioides luteus]GGR73866.1 LuxR family transcriptional regulator [Nocardioides luteus]GLJ68718.1 LuxR family transcriptional regulator [Nocardioides luteus]